jgi:hypothetical protein
MKLFFAVFGAPLAFGLANELGDVIWRQHKRRRNDEQG